MPKIGRSDKGKGKNKVKDVREKKAKGLKLNKFDRKRVVNVIYLFLCRKKLVFR